MLSTWWGVKGAIHWEVLPTSSTVTADLYCQQLDQVPTKLGEKENKVYFSMTTRNLTLQIRHVKKYWSSDGLGCHICRILQTWLSLNTICFVLLPMTWAEKKNDEEDDFKMDLGNCFSQKSQEFYERRILSLPERWRQVIDSNRAYIIKP
jgi:hypothetical protein